jgi:hypothetical protein
VVVRLLFQELLSQEVSMILVPRLLVLLLLALASVLDQIHLLFLELAVHDEGPKIMSLVDLVASRLKPWMFLRIQLLEVTV